MSVSVMNTEDNGGMTMTARDRLRRVLIKRLQEPMVTSQAIKANGKTAGCLQASTKDSAESSETEAPVKKQKRNIFKLKCSIISCDQSFCTMKQVIEHLNEVHNQNLEVQHLKFSTEAEFCEWMHNVQSSALCNFLRRNVRKSSSAVHAYFYCSRSGRSRMITEPRKRHLKVQGSSKINRTCPAHIVKHVRHDEISVDYYATHLCFTNTYEQLGHLRLSSADRAWLAEKLALKIPVEAILRDVRKTLDGQLTRLHLITRKDLINIKQAFRLNKQERQDENDAAGVAKFMPSYDGKDNSQIVDYKQQDIEQFAILPEGVEESVETEDHVYDNQFDRLTTICKGKYTKKLCELRKRHAASMTMQFISCEMVPGKQWFVRSEPDETECYTVLLANTECDCRIMCSDCAVCIHRYSCTCPDNTKFSNMCKHIHCVGMLNACMRPENTEEVVFLQSSADSDSNDRDQFQIDTTTEGIHLRQECEAAALVQQLSQPMAILEEKRKQLEEYILETSSIIKSLTTLEEMDVVATALCGIKPNLASVRARKATTSLIANIDCCENKSRKIVKKQRQFSSTKRRAPAVSSSALGKPLIQKDIELELLKTNLINNAIASVSCLSELQLQN